MAGWPSTAAATCAAPSAGRHRSAVSRGLWRSHPKRDQFVCELAIALPRLANQPLQPSVGDLHRALRVKLFTHLSGPAAAWRRELVQCRTPVRRQQQRGSGGKRHGRCRGGTGGSWSGSAPPLARGWWRNLACMCRQTGKAASGSHGGRWTACGRQGGMGMTCQMCCLLRTTPPARLAPASLPCPAVLVGSRLSGARPRA